MKLEIRFEINKKTLVKIETDIKKKDNEQQIEKIINISVKDNLDFLNMKFDDKDIITIKTDLYPTINCPEDKILLGGCKIAGAVVNATKVSVIDMAVKQMARQIYNSIKEL